MSAAAAEAPVSLLPVKEGLVKEGLIEEKKKENSTLNAENTGRLEIVKNNDEVGDCEAAKQKEKGKVSEEEAVSEEATLAKKRPREATLKKEKEWKGGPKDPTTLSPHELKEDTFLLKYPFIKLHNGMDDFPQQDRCGGHLLMDHGAICAFQQYLAPTLIEYHHLYWMHGEELATRAIHTALMFEVGRLADYLAQMKTEDDEDREGVNIWVKGAENEDEEAEDDGDGDSDAEGASKAWSSESSRERVQLKHESFSAASRPDFLIRGYDKGYLKRHQLRRFHPDALCTFLIVEPKNNKLPKVWTQGPGGGFQAGSYSVIEALKNLKKGRRKPIAFQGWSAHHWSYGELIVHGVVQVINGEVLGVEEGGILSTRLDLQTIFSEHQTELKRYMLDRNASYTDGEYLVGDLYLSNEIFDFPTPERLAWPSHGSLRFLEGILLICLGKKISAWKKEDVERLLTAVKVGAQRIEDQAFFSKEIYESIRRTNRLRR